MIAMQYNIVLPSDYDMEIIKNRTKNNGNKTDGFLDLELKAYLIAEKDKYNNYENQYAPFYLWRKEEGMNKFLLDGYFSNILNSFGWTKVNTWIVLHEKIRKTTEKQYALVEIVKIPVFSDFNSMCDNENENFESWIFDDATTAYITAYNPYTWELCHYHMTTDLDMLKKISNGNLIYDVHHIS